MRKENHYRINKAQVSIVFMLTLFMFAPSYLGAFSLDEVDEARDVRQETNRDAYIPINNAAQFNKPVLAPETQKAYEINSDINRLNPSQYNQYKPAEVKIEKIERPETVLPKIEDKVKVEIPFKEEAKKEIKPDVVKFEEKKQELNTVIQPIKQSVERPEAQEKDNDLLQGLEITEESSESNNLNLLSVGAKTEGKPGVVKNQIKLEGMPEDAQEEEGIQIVPKIKVEGVYQGTSNTNAEQKTGNFLFDNNSIDRR